MKALIFLVLLSGAAAAQDEGWLHADFRNEGTRVKDGCAKFTLKGAMACGIELFTDHPLHIAAGSLPPQNGFGLGGAFVAGRNTTNWRWSFDADAVVSTNASWRSGGYFTLVHNPPHKLKPLAPGEKPKKPPVLVHPYTVYNLYAQTISLNKLNYFGEGNDSPLAGASVFGMRETIVGANAVKPVYEWEAIRPLNLSLHGEINGRFVNIRGEGGQSFPSIETVYTNATAPGLASQPGFLQLAQGIRVDPVLWDRLEFDYSGNFQEFIAPSNSTNSFERWTVDLNTTFYLQSYQKATPATVKRTAPGTGPNSCALPGDACPAITTNHNGSVGFRLLVSESMNSATSVVPFYLQQTLGGGDINGGMSLGSYQDYRFRAPNLLLMQAHAEYAIWGPLGLKFQADEGRVAMTRSDLGFSHLRHSFAAGLTIRAGGFPMVSMMFAWGGPEGHHNIFNMNSSLLGGGARPLLD
ncbi:MAG TPA: hypothetical protein VMH04_13105 [Candidatus Solibacter sp.]|nr:hypothetical protein [Candidatus Solibacter sp.]